VSSQIKEIGKHMFYPPYLLFRSAVGIKNLMYNCGIFKVENFDVNVISVGGITFGGSGKSPMTMYLAYKAAEIESNIGKTAIVSRGYRRSSKGFLVVSDGKKVLSNVHQAGDELYMMAKRLSSTVVIADENRSRGVKSVVEMFDAKNIILDDGFQHRSLGRNTDIVMLEPDILLDHSVSFKRETLNALKRASAVVVLDADERKSITDKLKDYNNIKLFYGRRKITGFYSLKNGKKVNIQNLKNRKISAFCGIANPQNFINTLNLSGLQVETALAFKDHCRYNEIDLSKVARFFTTSGAEILLTTEKDAVKIPPVLYSLPIYYTTIDLEIENEKELLKLVFEDL